MKEKKFVTIEYLESILKTWNIRKCDVCSRYELPSSGVGGIQADDLGTDSKGRNVHLRCAMT